MVHREHNTGSNRPEQSPSESWGDLVTRLKSTNASLRDLYELRDQRQTSSWEIHEKQEEQRLTAEKGSLLVDVLLLRDRGVIPHRFPITITQDQTELLHPFSQNVVELHIPLADSPQTSIITKTFLHQLRKPGVIHHSEEALHLIGDYHTQPEPTTTYIRRSENEVEHIIDAEKMLRQQKGPAEDRYFLNRLRTHLVLDRFVGLRTADRLPPGYAVGVGFLSGANNPDNPGLHLVEVSVMTPEPTSAFTILPPWAYRHLPELQVKLNQTLDAIGGFDYYDYRKSR